MRRMVHVPRTLVALATFNEAENLPPLLEEILQVLPEADVLVVDDNSPDGTGRWCEQQAQAEPRLSCIHRPEKMGLGTAAVAAIKHAIENHYERLVTMDADYSHPPAVLPKLVAATDQADVAIGSRYCADGKIVGWPWRRRFLSWSANLGTRLLLGLPVQDCTSGMRCYRVEQLSRLDLERIRTAGFGYLEELLLYLQHGGARVVEVPITFTDRQRGRSKIGLYEAVSGLAMLLRLSPSRLWRRP